MPKKDGGRVFEDIKRVEPDIKALFISGYTAKVAGTEMGVTEPQATFSAS